MVSPRNSRTHKYTYAKVYTRYCLEHLSSYMQVKVAERDCVYCIKEMQTLDTKTRYALIGTWNQFCTAGVYAACLQALPKHKEHMIKNEGRLKKYMNQEFPAL